MGVVTLDNLRRFNRKSHADHADNIDGEYRRPDGNRGKHIVKPECSDEEIPVSGPPNYTLKPGTRVLLGRHQGTQGWVMFPFPPPAGRGSSGFQSDTGDVYVPPPPTPDPPAPVCPVHIAGHHYLAIGHGHSPDTFFAWEFIDGAYDSDLGPPAGSVIATTHGDIPSSGPIKCHKIPGEDAIVFLTGSVSPTNQVAYLVKWDYGTDTWTSVTLAGGALASDVRCLLVSGGKIFYLHASGAAGTYPSRAGTLRLRSIDYDLTNDTPVGAGGPTQTLAQRFTLLEQASGFDLLTESGGNAVWHHDGTGGGSFSSTARTTDGVGPATSGRLVDGWAPVYISSQAGASSRLVYAMRPGGNSESILNLNEDGYRICADGDAYVLQSIHPEPTFTSEMARLHPTESSYLTVSPDPFADNDCWDGDAKEYISPILQSVEAHLGYYAELLPLS